MYKRNPFILVIILAYLMALTVYLCEPLMACEQSGSQNASADVSNSTPSSTNEENSQQGLGSQNERSSVASNGGVAQADNRWHEGNGGESAPLIDCSDPFWWGMVPCEVLHEQD